MPKIYASLIRKGLKTIDEVPNVIREDVRLLLEERS
ncbi:CD1375 family protein [Paenibacillus donghaensis]|nr:CD1375 family protein [Paenibacillus donghaensis]